MSADLDMCECDHLMVDHIGATGGCLAPDGSGGYCPCLGFRPRPRSPTACPPHKEQCSRSCCTKQLMRCYGCGRKIDTNHRFLCSRCLP